MRFWIIAALVIFVSLWALTNEVRSIRSFITSIGTTTDNQPQHQILQSRMAARGKRQYSSHVASLPNFVPAVSQNGGLKRIPIKKEARETSPPDLAASPTLLHPPRIVHLSNHFPDLPTTTRKHISPLSMTDHNAELETGKNLTQGGVGIYGMNSTIEEREETKSMYHFVQPHEYKYYFECQLPVATPTSLRIRPTCNILHETTDYSLLTMKGSWRSAWLVPDAAVPEQDSLNTTLPLTNASQESPPAAVLKLLHLHRSFDGESYGLHQMDSLAMERLTHSRHVVSQYAYCGQSVMVQNAPHKGRIIIKDGSLSTRDRVQLARHLSKGLADIHQAGLVHNDINVANLVGTSSSAKRKKNAVTIKYNDFNIAMWIKQLPPNELTIDDKKTRKGDRKSRRMLTNVDSNNNNNSSSSSKEILSLTDNDCGFPVRFEGPLWRSPEEIQNVSYVSSKIDVYALGNVLFQILTRHQPWTWLEPERLTLEQVAQLKLEGRHPTMPSKFSNHSANMGTMALYFATQSCHCRDPRERPTAMQLVKGLDTTLDWMRGANKQNVTRKMIKDLFGFCGQ